MNFTIKTPLGNYKYKFQIVYEGIKILDPKIEEENLAIFDKVAKKNGLRYGMCYGTLLGAIREHDFIAHDEDIDLFILKEDLDQFKSMLFDLRENGLEVIRYDRRDGLCSVMRKGEYIDIYIFDKLVPGVRETVGYPIPEKYVTELAPMKFKGLDILAPVESEEAMIFCYGETWNIPIVMKPYEMSAIKKFKVIFEWWVYYLMPNFLFKPIMEHRAKKKVMDYNRCASVLNKLKGKTIVEPIPVDCYKIK